jgi:hypothetical protein
MSTMFEAVAQARQRNAVSLAVAQSANLSADRQFQTDLHSMRSGNWTWAGGYRPSVDALVCAHRVGGGGWR